MKIENAKWVGIEGYENHYQINEEGLVRSLHLNRKGQLLERRIDRAGYYTVRLSNNGKIVTRYLHRLLAQAFIPNPVQKKYVNHKNGNKHDNNLGNLEWSTQGENVKHAYLKGLIKKKERQVLDISTGAHYNSTKEAAFHYNIGYSTLKNFLNGNRPNLTSLRYAA